MVGWSIFGGYVIGVVAMARFLAPVILDWNASDFYYRGPDTEDVVLSRVMAFLIGLIWPFVLVGLLVFWKTPRSQAQIKRDLHKREEMVKSRERYIEKLERETGIIGE